jgi:iron complex outermembrane receptor protein
MISMDKGNQFGQSRAFRAVLLAGAGLGLCGVTAPAFAQDAAAPAIEAPAAPTTLAPAAEPAPNQEIVVTGSRIARRDFSSTTPILTAGQDLLSNSGTVALETNLNKLPQFTPDKAPTQGGDVQPTATNTPGAATVSLRGIGANRNLVLVDGRRATPSNANMVVDLNTIPAAAVERVEVITGGASSTYGADAVGGVVNFILKKNFQGLQLDGHYGMTQRGNGEEYRIAGFMGANFADGRGNITLGLEVYNRSDAKKLDFPWFKKFNNSNQTGGTEFFSNFPTFVTNAGNAPSQALVNSIFSQAAAGAVPNNASFYFNPGNGTNNTAFGGFDARTTAGAYRFSLPTGNGSPWEKLANGQLAQNFQDELAQLPLNRYNLYTRGTYEVNDWVSVFGQGYFNRSSNRTVQQPSPAVNGWGVSIPVDGRALPTELASLLASRPNPTAPWALNSYFAGINRNLKTDTYTYQVMAGLQGKVLGTDWTWEIYGSQGEATTNTKLTGAFSLERFRTIITAPNWGAGFKAQGNATAGGFGAATASCTSGLNPFDNVATSQDCLDAIKADLKNRSHMRQTVWEGSLQGGLLTLPGGQLRFAAGLDYRSNKFEFENDNLTTQGSSFLDQAIGIYPSGNSSGEITTKEVYGELLIPIVKDLPFAKNIDLEPGIRYSDYNTTGGSTTFKILGNWDVTSWLRFRGGFNRAERTPNIGELYLALQQSFGVATNGDLCSTNNSRAYSAGTGNTTNRAAVRALCETIMNRADPTGQTSVNFYANANNQGAGSGFVFTSLKGNPNLRPEVAKTWTYGTVISSPFENPWLRRLRLSVDYYSIKVDHAIAPQTADILQRQCFDTAFNPTLSASATACQGITRNINIGTIGDLQGTYLNAGRFRVKGIDFQLDWGIDMQETLGVPGRFNANVVVNYLDSVKSSPLDVLPLVEYAGTLGPNAGDNGLNANSYRWRSFSTFNYAVGKASFGMQWQHLPSIKSATAATNAATTFAGAPSYDLFNLFTSYAVTRDVQLTIGVDNLFDKAPPITEYNTAPPAGQLAGGGIGASGTQGTFFDVLGRRFYVNAKFKF